jgi:BON domain
MRARIVSFCLFIIGGLLLACSTKPNDAKIAQDIQTKASADQVTQGSELNVSSKKGKVTLTGKTKTQAARQQIESIAKQEPGVVDVDDETTVEPELTSTTTAEPAQSAHSERPSVPTQSAAAPPPPPPPPPKPIVVPAGTTLTIRTNQALGSKTSQAGGVFTGTIATPVSMDGEVVIPAGSAVTGIVKEAKKAGRFKGNAVLRLALNSVTINGHTYNVQAEEVAQTSTGKGKRTAGMVVGGTGVGAAIGGIVGGGKGAAIGALTGAAAGTVGAGTTGKRDIDLPAEAALSFKLTHALTLKRA